ncbi:dehydratase [Paraburkholderia steynii]|uniref:Dehydratase n=1 Tax=Paraburkholderia steynii TaxID=1245441 RepID=A0A4R0XCE3_9BURK|nr:dehydratase [Paraburkholderia steynii]
MDLSYEDLEVGKRYDVGTHTFTREEIVKFAEQFDPQPFHLNEEAARSSLFGTLIASGWHTCCLMMGMLARNFLRGSTLMGSPGVDEIRWLKPVHVGDTLSMTNTVMSKRISSSKPDRGVVETRWDGINQSGETVVIVRSKAIFGLRHPLLLHRHND